MRDLNKVSTKKLIICLSLAFIIFITQIPIMPIAMQATDEITVFVEPSDKITPFYNTMQQLCVWSSTFFNDIRVSQEPDNFVKIKTPYVEYPIMMTFTGGRGNLVPPEEGGQNNNWYTEDEYGNPKYDFFYPINALRNVLRGGVKPLIVIGQVPNDLSTQPEDGGYGGWYGNKYPPKDYDKYFNYIQAFAQAIVNEFGIEEVRSWKFRMYTEPDNSDWFVGNDHLGTLASDEALNEFLKMYDYTEAALANVVGEDYLFFFLGNLQISVANMDRYLNHFAYGINYYSGKIGTKCDALSMSQYFYGTVNVEPFGEILVQMKRKADQYPSLNIREIGVGEGGFLTDRDGKNFNGSVGFTEEYGSALARMFDIGNGSSPGYFANWTYHTNRENVDATQPVLATCAANVGELLVKLMSGDRVSVSSFGSGSNGNILGQMASYDADNQKLYVLLYNHNGSFGDKNEETIALNINNIEAAGINEPTVRHWRVDQNNSNFGTTWLKDTQHISKNSSLYDAEQFCYNRLNAESQAIFDTNYDTYKELSALSTYEPDQLIDIIDNTIYKTVILPHHSVTLLEISNVNVLTDSSNSIFVICDENGKVEPSGNAGGIVKVENGGDQTFIITPNEGYTVKTVKVDGVDATSEVMMNNKQYSFIDVAANHTFEVAFMKVEAELPWIDTNYNYVRNYSFENPLEDSDWFGYYVNPGSEWTTGGYRETGAAYDGSAYLSIWHEIEYSTGKGQIIKDIPNGVYKLSVYAQSARSGGSVYMYANTSAVDDFSVKPEDIGNPPKVNIPENVSQWTQYIINDIEVTNGQIVIGFVNEQVPAYGWTRFDNVSLTMQNQTFEIISEAGEGGRISPNGKQKAEGYQNLSFTITPDPGYIIARVIVDAGTTREKDVVDELVSGSGKIKYYTLIGIAFDHMINVSFKSSMSTDDNYIRNYSFEELDAPGDIFNVSEWVWYDTETSPAWARGGYQINGDVIDGYAALCFWHDNIYQMRKGQIVNNLPNGLYALSVYSKNNVSSGDIYMYANTSIINDFSINPEIIGEPRKIYFTQGNEQWTQYIIENIMVDNGQLTIGFVNDNVNASAWIHVDNVVLNLISAAPKNIVNVCGVDLLYSFEDGVVIIAPDQEQINAILTADGNDIIINLCEYEAVDFYAPADWFKGVDKKIIFITSSGNFEVNTKSLWNNSGKTRKVTVRDYLKFKNI